MTEQANNQLTPRERYRRDSMFRQLVDYMRVMIERAQYTPTELREAAILAATMELERRPPPPVYIVSPDTLIQAGVNPEDVRTIELRGGTW